MGGVRIETEGLAGVLRNLDLTNKKIKTEVRNEIIKAAMDTVADVKEDPVYPKDTGRLKASFTFFHSRRRSKSYKDEDGNTFISTLKGLRIAPGELSAAVGTNVDYAEYIEFGTKTRSHRFGHHKLTNAFEKRQDELLKTLRKMFSGKSTALVKL